MLSSQALVVCRCKATQKAGAPCRDAATPPEFSRLNEAYIYMRAPGAAARHVGLHRPLQQSSSTSAQTKSAWPAAVPPWAAGSAAPPLLLQPMQGC